MEIEPRHLLLFNSSGCNQTVHYILAITIHVYMYKKPIFIHMTIHTFADEIIIPAIATIQYDTLSYVNNESNSTVFLGIYTYVCMYVYVHI